MPNPNGGPVGSGTLVTTVHLTDKAARYVKAAAALTGPRYRKAEADVSASRILEDLADSRIVGVTDEMIAAIGFIQDARQMCWSPQALSGLDQLIMALEAARA